MKRKQLNFWQTTELIPPILARLLARIPRRRSLTDGEIAQKSGLSIDRVFVIQHLTTWDGVSIPEARKFLIGCSIDFCNYEQLNRAKVYLLDRETSWKYLRTSAEWRTKYEPLMRRWRASLTEKTK